MKEGWAGRRRSVASRAGRVVLDRARVWAQTARPSQHVSERREGVGSLDHAMHALESPPLVADRERRCDSRAICADTPRPRAPGDPAPASGPPSLAALAANAASAKRTTHASG